MWKDVMREVALKGVSDHEGRRCMARKSHGVEGGKGMPLAQCPSRSLANSNVNEKPTMVAVLFIRCVSN